MLVPRLMRMSEPVAPAARKTAIPTQSGLATAAGAASRHGIAARPGAALAIAFAIVLLVGVAAALAWRAAEHSPAWGVAGVAAPVLLGGAGAVAVAAAGAGRTP